MIKNMLITSWFIFIVFIIIGSDLIFELEQADPSSNITSYSDALWWSINVASAVGDCSLSPNTLGGRIVSVVLMIVGYALFTLNIGALVTFFHKHIHTKQ